VRQSGHFLDGLSVLVVEDEAIVSMLLEDMLGDLGAQVRHAGTLTAALAAIDAEMPKLALLDVNIGGEKIFPVADRLDAAGVPIVFTTGYGRKGLEPRWERHAVLQKPFDEAGLTAALRQVLR